jgi:hypothetical protein
LATVVVLIALLFWVGVFLIYFTAQGLTPGEFFFGRYEPLPDDLGTWRELGVDAESGLLSEERFLLPGDRPKSPYLLRQARFRDPVTRAIVRVEAEIRVPRRRVSARSPG